MEGFRTAISGLWLDRCAALRHVVAVLVLQERLDGIDVGYLPAGLQLRLDIGR